VALKWPTNIYFSPKNAYIAHFWNSVGPIYSTKKVANQKRCVGGVPVESNLFVPFRIEKAYFSEKKFSRPQTNFYSGKISRFDGFDNQRIKSDSQNSKDKTWCNKKFCCTVLFSLTSVDTRGTARGRNNRKNNFVTSKKRFFFVKVAS